MPTINKGTKKKKYSVKNGKNAYIAHLYNSQKWVKLRNAHLMQNPLCKHCLDNGRITAGEEIHHVIPISHGKTLEEQTYLAFNAENLITLCKKCHKKIHNKMKKGEV